MAQYPQASWPNRRESRTKYVVVYEQAPRNWAAYVPDLPGCVATGQTRAEVERLIGEAIRMHIEAMREAGEPVPEPGAMSQLIEV